MSMSVRQASQRVILDDRVGVRRLHPTQICQGRRVNVESDLSTAVIASFAAVSLFCSVEAPAMAEVEVQGGVFESLGFESPDATSKKGVQLSRKKLRSAFGPSSETSPPPAPPVKKTTPTPPPSPKAKTPNRAPEPKPSTGRRKLVGGTKSTTPEKKPTPPPKPSKPVIPSKASKPSSSSSLALPSVKAPEVKLPEFKAPELPPISASNKDATEAGAVIALELLLILIASSTVSGLLKKT